MTSPDVLTITGLTVTYAGDARAVREVDLRLPNGSSLALVGESGCGKSTVAKAVLGLLPAGTRVRGSIVVAGTELVGADARTLRAARGRVVGSVPQNPAAACDPLRRVGHHVEEAWRAHGERPPPGAITRLAHELGIPAAAGRLRQRPHQWSGGMLQRATIAAAIAHEPVLVVADEPSSALDADRADAALERLRRAARSLLLISHDLTVVARHADQVAIVYAGRVVEIGATASVLAAPRHPYTRALVAAAPRPGAGLPPPLPGAPPRPTDDPPGCPFAARCAQADTTCWEERPPLSDGTACWRVGS